ncbi:MAG TPA: family 10 glycosylhydrolase [Vicinamibacterales bacterium]|nr:family 10 glycosylhydrolase [Vicinamibacterales bacterium]
MNITHAALRAPLLLAVFACLVVVGREPRAASDGPEVRALWVTRSSLVSPDRVAAMVRSAAASGFNTLLVQVRGRGDAYFPSRVEPRAQALAGQPLSFDPLASTLALARARGLRVHAWVNVNLTSSGAELPTSREHVVYEHPEWLMVPRALAFELGRIDPRSPEYVGRLARWTRSLPTEVEGLYSSPVHAGAVDRLVSVVDELVSNYALDGLHLDYARYPSASFDYSRGALGAFRTQIDGELSGAERLRYGTGDVAALVAVTELKPERWAEFRRSRLNALVMRVRTVAKARRPGIVLSAAVYPDSSQAASARLQDWRSWIEHRLIDVICPMAYTPDTATFAAQIATVRQHSGGQPVWAGIGAYRLSSSRTVENIRTARRLGAEGIVLFSYDSLAQSPHGADYLPALGRAAFRP